MSGRSDPRRSRLVRKLRTVFTLPFFTMVWLVPVWVMLGLCRLAILVVPLRFMSGFYGQELGICPWVPLVEPSRLEQVRDIRRTIGLAATYSPWTANCYPQALTARIMLGLYGLPYSLHFGLKRDVDGRGIAAHAWVACGSVAVSGGHGFLHYTVVRSFAARGLFP